MRESEWVMKETETPEAYQLRVYRDAIYHRNARLKELFSLKSREDVIHFLKGLTGIAIEVISYGKFSVCSDCGAEYEDVPLHCKSCGSEDFCEVIHLLNGEYYLTSEQVEGFPVAKNVKVIDF